VPINLSVSQVFRIGKQPVSVALGGRYYAEGSDNAPEWGARLTFTLLYPTAKRAAAGTNSNNFGK
jgi:hypothetical protein